GSRGRCTILQESKALLRCPTGSDQAVAEALSAIMLLEDSSPRQALAEFLLARKLAIQQLLNQPHHEAAGRPVSSSSPFILLIAAARGSHAACDFLLMPSSSSFQQPGTLCLPPHPLVLLPAARGSTAHPAARAPCDFVLMPSSSSFQQPGHSVSSSSSPRPPHSSSQRQQGTLCSEDIRTGVRTLLGYVKSMKGLAGIRDAVWELLSSDSSSHSWEAVCRRLLDRPVSLWEELLQQLFLDRLQTLSKEGFDSISSSSKQLLAVALQELEVKGGSSALSKQMQLEQNVALFLWSESPGDLPGDAAWVSVGQRGPFARSGLAMKAQALTPCLQSFCSTLDSKLKARLEDVLSYLPGEESVPKEPPRSAFDRFADGGTVQGLLRDHCVLCVQHLLGCVQEQLQSPQSQLEPPGDTRLNAVLFLARLCQALPELCPHLQRCVLGRAGGAEPREPRPAKKLGKGKAQEVSPELAKWQGVKAELLQQSLVAYQLWRQGCSSGAVESWGNCVASQGCGGGTGRSSQGQSRDVGGNGLHRAAANKLLSPAQPSWHVQCLLFSLCQELNRVGGHTLPKVTLQELLRSCMAEVLAAYEKLLQQKQEKVPGCGMGWECRDTSSSWNRECLSVTAGKGRQPCTHPASPKTEAEGNVTLWLCLGLLSPKSKELLLPFQLLSPNSKPLLVPFQVLFGLLTGTENQYTSRGGVPSSQELHNILPLAGSSRRAAVMLRVPFVSPKGQAAAAVLPREDEEGARPGSLFRQLLADDEDAAAPSLFKLGWLSGMAK
ncbi:COG1 protein, partial [Leiothrix lutea]|nr:COG1 protein [Leiothrix lutea]